MLIVFFLKMPFDVEGEMARGDVLRETAVHGEEGESVGAGVREVCAAHGQRHTAFEFRLHSSVDPGIDALTAGVRLVPPAVAHAFHACSE